MKKIVFLSLIALSAPIAASAQSCGYFASWDESRQACVNVNDHAANMIQESGNNTWMQPLTDPLSDMIRTEGNTSSCNYDNCAWQQ